MCLKVAYASDREARKALTRLIRIRAVQGSEKMEIASYACRFCGKWHLTSQEQTK